MGTPVTSRFIAALALAAGAMLALPASAQNYAFYDATPAEIAGGPPGSIIRSQEFRGSPWNTRGYKVLYRSTGLAGEPIAVSALMVVPTAQPPAGGHPVIAWAHPTTGVARKCAPSLAGVDALKLVPGLQHMVDREFVMVATDYPGLGTVGEHPYLVGVSEGRAVLDSVRAARALAGASHRFAVWGHSQGGHAALWTGEIAKQYAPDLEAVGVAAAAPASLLGQLFEDDLSTDAGRGLTALALWAWSRVFDAPLEPVVMPQAMQSVAVIGAECLSGFSDLIADVGAIKHLRGSFLKADPVKTPPWSNITAENTPGQLHPGAPVFIAQGSADTIVDPPVTTEFATKLCNQGAAVRFFEVPDATHTIIAMASAAAAVEWMAARFAGEPAPTNCIRR